MEPDTSPIDVEQAQREACADILFATAKCIRTVERYPVTLRVCTEPAHRIKIGHDWWRIDVSMHKETGHGH